MPRLLRVLAFPTALWFAVRFSGSSDNLRRRPDYSSNLCPPKDFSFMIFLFFGGGGYSGFSFVFCPCSFPVICIYIYTYIFIYFFPCASSTGKVQKHQKTSYGSQTGWAPIRCVIWHPLKSANSESPKLVVSNLAFATFTWRGSFSPFCSACVAHFRPPLLFRHFLSGALPVSIKQ